MRKFVYLSLLFVLYLIYILSILLNYSSLYFIEFIFIFAFIHLYCQMFIGFSKKQKIIIPLICLLFATILQPLFYISTGLKTYNFLFIIPILSIQIYGLQHLKKSYLKLFVLILLMAVSFFIGIDYSWIAIFLGLISFYLKNDIISIVLISILNIILIISLDLTPLLLTGGIGFIAVQLISKRHKISVEQPYNVVYLTLIIGTGWLAQYIIR